VATQGVFQRQRNLNPLHVWRIKTAEQTLSLPAIQQPAGQRRVYKNKICLSKFFFFIDIATARTKEKAEKITRKFATLVFTPY
jgi:hypothetical protein